jgi:predicted flavoprotein YhiN
MKGKPELDDPRNLMNVCHECHMSGEVNGFEARRRFWQRQCARYGEEDMRRWVESLPLKHKERFW